MDKKGHISNPEDVFSFSGSGEELKKRLRAFMSEADADLFIKFIHNCGYIHAEDESIEIDIDSISIIESISTDSIGAFYPLIGSILISPPLLGIPALIPALINPPKKITYNINIKALTLVAIALLLDIKLTMGVASSILAIMGFNGQAIVRIDTSEGEMCLILEAMHSKNRIINEDVFLKFNSECVHHDLDCRYRIDDKCTITTDTIGSILDGLCDKNVFRKIGNLYQYNF